jgi:hypothetical protein
MAGCDFHPNACRRKRAWNSHLCGAALAIAQRAYMRIGSRGVGLPGEGLAVMKELGVVRPLELERQRIPRAHPYERARAGFLAWWNSSTTM